MEKTYTLDELTAFVGRADSIEKVNIAREYINKLRYLRFREKAALLDKLDAMEDKLSDDFLAFDDDFSSFDEDRGSYSPSAPWNAPGMRVSDFISGVCYC